jgi:acyl-CoA thioesterase FadM
MSVRYHPPVQERKEYVVEGRVDRLSGRKITTAARMADCSGKTVAEATALFIRMPGGGS